MHNQMMQKHGVPDTLLPKLSNQNYFARQTVVYWVVVEGCEQIKTVVVSVVSLVPLYFLAV